LSIGIIAFALVMFVAHLGPDPHAVDYPPIEVLLPLVMLLSVAGLGLAWRWEGLGGAIAVSLFLAHMGLYRVIRGKPFPLRGVPILSPVLITGLLFLLCWSLGKLRASPPRT
jgi:hypothetical protein